MTAKTTMVDEYSFAAEGMAGTACSVALAKVSSLARFAPTRQVLDAIATLTELGGRVEAALAASDRALANGRQNEAVNRLDQAMALMDDMARLALDEAACDSAVSDRTRHGSAA
jgi:hypothetical protein